MGVPQKENARSLTRIRSYVNGRLLRYHRSTRGRLRRITAGFILGIAPATAPVADGAFWATGAPKQPFFVRIARCESSDFRLIGGSRFAKEPFLLSNGAPAVPRAAPQTTMGKQYNKLIKRTRRKAYLKRKREQMLAKKKLAKPAAKKAPAKKAAAKKAPAKKAAAKKAPAKKAAAKKAPAKKAAAKKAPAKKAAAKAESEEEKEAAPAADAGAEAPAPTPEDGGGEKS